MYKGIAGSEGIGIGTVVLIEEHEINIETKRVEETGAEIERLQNAIEKFVADTNVMAEKMDITVGKKDADILRGHIQMLQDPMIEEQISALVISEKITAEMAVEQVLEQTAEMFSQIPDELLQQRATDFRDIKTRMLKILLGIEDVDISQVPAGTVIVARDLTPSMTAGINPENIEGILTEVGGRTSHSAILARAMEVPAVLSIENICSIAKNGDKVVLDGTSGEAILNPDDETVEKFKKMYSDYQNEKALLKEYAGKPSQTKDGVKVELVCNIGKPADANKAVECDGEGIGLFRTEFLFMDRDSMPTEEEQFEAYKEVAEKMKGKPVIIRTLDIGGDKDVPYLGLEHEDNPFLGFRAIRYCLQRKDIYEIQLKALLRASAFGKIKIMVPLVTGVDELRQVKAMIKEIMAELDKEGVAYNKNIEVGVMMETPAACMVADVLAKEAAFFSIGTNDLTGYTMAVDRGNAKVAYLYSTYNPAVLRAIKRIIECGKKEGIMVGMCGEAAADSKLIPLLLAFGLDEFSVSATSVLKTRKTISDCTMDECKALADKVMACVTEEEVLEILG
ncbi:phosphoenolpyruvate--protein phosphotransferase [Eubacterium ventriosum]|jgi:phosphotransferase system enzyme I (PtsI)|uniref:Phosphoenolpyruvate-protein phosphotransferase n=1 Tax=Eubacterium ventriosum ATCC 27560 TaxID=411463 RepID=A5Z3P7_9FIRM|nr:phosphoenolpyruvate--protein phosphotransferase [Eubacterium ventriosum]EDM52412.1 phosphoenolpyruvate-protein phosphotransferase [Eubacterium ventriosum ATCC 27560]PWM04166.1 MAG: phosphoenolpyruvate--protein phosphotransferase [Eubacterium ventriosum]UWP36370.1 phosphoenolpyruvate--protein phosphotransferase [Eubacterium ventriosum]